MQGLLRGTGAVPVFGHKGPPGTCTPYPCARSCFAVNCYNTCRHRKMQIHAFDAPRMNGRVIRGTGAVFGHKGPPPGTCTPYPYARAFPDTPHRRARPVYAHMGGLSFASGPLMVGWVMYGHVRVAVAFIPAETK